MHPESLWTIFNGKIGIRMNNQSSERPVNGGGIPESDPRVQLATERTLLAWVRSGLALMAFGFVVARFALIIKTLGMDTHAYLTLEATVIGVLMILLGVVATAGAPWHYRLYFRRIREHCRRPFAATWLVMFVAYATAAIGVVLAVYLIFVDFSQAHQGQLRQEIFPNPLEHVSRTEPRPFAAPATDVEGGN